MEAEEEELKIFTPGAEESGTESTVKYCEFCAKAPLQMPILDFGVICSLK